MAKTPAFKAAYPYQQDVLALPVSDINTASEWYSEHFDMVEVERKETPVPTVTLKLLTPNTPALFLQLPGGV